MERRHSIYAMLEGGDNGCGKIGSARRSADVSAHLGPECIHVRAVQRGALQT